MLFLDFTKRGTSCEEVREAFLAVKMPGSINIESNTEPRDIDEKCASR